MERRQLLHLALVAPVVAALAACGSDADQTDPESPDGSTLPPATDPPPTPETTDEPRWARDDVVLELGFYGGFTTRDIAFQSPPALLVTGDGRVITQAAVAAIYPGPLLPQHTLRTITPTGLRRLIEVIEEAGLLADIDYTSESEVQIADAATTTVRITVDGETHEHAAYALGFGGAPGDEVNETPERRALQDVVDRLGDLASVVPATELGPEEMWAPDAFQLLAEPAGDLSGYDPPATVVDWPATSSLSLAGLTTCAEVPRSAVGDLLDAATQLTFFNEGDVTYQLLARPAYPGRSC